MADIKKIYRNKNKVVVGPTIGFSFDIEEGKYQINKDKYLDIKIGVSKETYIDENKINKAFKDIVRYLDKNNIEHINADLSVNKRNTSIPLALLNLFKNVIENEPTINHTSFAFYNAKVSKNIEDTAIKYLGDRNKVKQEGMRPIGLRIDVNAPKTSKWYKCDNNKYIKEDTAISRYFYFAKSRFVKYISRVTVIRNSATPLLVVLYVTDMVYFTGDNRINLIDIKYGLISFTHNKKLQIEVYQEKKKDNKYDTLQVSATKYVSPNGGVSNISVIYLPGNHNIDKKEAYRHVKEENNPYFDENDPIIKDYLNNELVLINKNRNRKTLSSLLDFYLTRSNMSEYTLSKLSGVNSITINRYHSGEVSVCKDENVIRNIAIALGLNEQEYEEFIVIGSTYIDINSRRTEFDKSWIRYLDKKGLRYDSRYINYETITGVFLLIEKNLFNIDIKEQ